MKEKRQGKLHCKVLFHQDNAPAHVIRNDGFELLQHPPYSPDLATSDSYLFSKLKEFVKGCKFADDNDVISIANGWLEKQVKQFFCN